LRALAGARHRRQTGDGIATLREVETHAPDVLFLDIQMPASTGLDVARQLSGRCHIVFVTAYDQHTLAAFEEGAADYLLKPADAARLATTVARLKERVGRPAPAIEGLLRELGAPRRGFLRWITRRTVRRFASSPGRRVLFPGRQQVHAGGHRRGGIADPQAHQGALRRAGSFRLLQIHRSTIVNVHAIAGVVRDLRGRTQVRLKRRDELLIVSDAYAIASAKCSRPPR